MQCPKYEDSRRKMLQDIEELPNDIGTTILAEPGELLYILLGKSNPRLDLEQMIQIWIISATCISKMYRSSIKDRTQINKQVP